MSRDATIEVQARVLTDTGESIVALVVRDNARGEDVDPVTVHMSLAEAIRVAEMIWGVVGDVRRADASGRSPARLTEKCGRCGADVSAHPIGGCPSPVAWRCAPASPAKS